MPKLLAVGCALACACHRGAWSGGEPDGPGIGGEGGPHLVASEPGDWLHAPARFPFDAPVDPGAVARAQVTATLAGTPVDATAAIDPDDPATVDVTVDPAARGTGTLAIALAGAGEVDGELAPWAIAPGPAAAAAPALAVTPAGAVIAAWPSAGAVAAGMLERGRWQLLGAPQPCDASSFGLALDRDGAPVLAWIAASVAHVARWSGGAWHELSSPGAATALALAGGDELAIAVFGQTVGVRELADDGTWKPIGSELALVAPPVGQPQLAIGSPGHPALAWIDAAGNLIAYRYDALWIALAPIALGAPPRGSDRVSLAARDDTLAIAWDQWAGSFAVLAAEAVGGATAWTHLGRALDVDVAGDALAPAIALDADHHPIVAWTETIETARRGVVARWDGAAWQVAAGATWMPDAAATGASIALAAGDAPVVATSAAGQLAVARFDGPAQPRLARASVAGCAVPVSAPPATLSRTGCFTIASPFQAVAHPGLVPYDVVVELWTDGARKRRWVALPDGAIAGTSPTGAWDVPPGTRVFKEFAYETTPGDPATRRPMETRVFVNDAVLGWRGFSYKWRADGSDAELEPDSEDTFAWPLDDGTTHVHFYPSRTDCASCHDSTYGPLLGLRAPQLARWFDYDGVIADQPPMLARLGVAPAMTVTPFVSPHDPSQTWELRMRGYMAANCAHCHNPDHVAVHDLRYDTPLAGTNLCPDIVVGDPASSKVYQLVASRPGMPPIGTLAVDPLAVQILGTWITNMTSCP
ncbi:MAG: hypothetical protein ACM31C_20425 [Acidobacteriota bacterium]